MPEIRTIVATEVPQELIPLHAESEQTVRAGTHLQQSIAQLLDGHRAPASVVVRHDALIEIFKRRARDARGAQGLAEQRRADRHGRDCEDLRLPSEGREVECFAVVGQMEAAISRCVHGRQTYARVRQP